MERREFIVTLGVSLLAAPLAAEAQTRRVKPSIAVLFVSVPTTDLSGPNPKDSTMAAFLEGMRELGWVDGPADHPHIVTRGKTVG